MKRIRLIARIAALLLLVPGCTAIFQPKTITPIAFKQFGNTNNPKHIAILLPGIRDRIDVFEKNGFIEIARPLLEKNPDTALIVVDAHWGYYRERKIVERLTQDIVNQHPNAKLTFVGASLGGFGSLLMAMEHSHRVESLVLLAPFLGEDDYSYLDRLKTQGIVDLPDDEDLTLALNRSWKFLLNPQRKVAISIAYGTEDSFAPYYGFLMRQTPALIQIESVQGGHDWETWRSVWQKYASSVLAHSDSRK